MSEEKMFASKMGLFDYYANLPAMPTIIKTDTKYDFKNHKNGRRASTILDLQKQSSEHQLAKSLQMSHSNQEAQRHMTDLKIKKDKKNTQSL